MTKVLDVSAQPQLAEILRFIEAGDAVVLTRDGREIAEVKPVEAAEEIAEPRKERVLGLGAGGEFYMADDFDAELPKSFWMSEE